MLRPLGVRLAWLAVAALIAIGGAGIVAAMDRPPLHGARAELTWTGDTAATRVLDAATLHLEELDQHVASLGDYGRMALANAIARDSAGHDVAVTGGTQVLAQVDTDIASFRTALNAVPGLGPGEELRIAPSIRDRYDALVAALPAVTSIDQSWNRLSLGTISALRLTDLLTQHDVVAGNAALDGSKRLYAAAIQKLATADGLLTQAEKLRDGLKNTTDVSTLTTWIDRNRTYDKALTTLYSALVKSKGKVTDAVRTAFKAEEKARSELPPDTRGLTVIMSDIAQGGLNQAVIAIETARGDLDAALANANEAASPSVEPSDSDAPSQSQAPSS